MKTLALMLALLWLGALPVMAHPAIGKDDAACHHPCPPEGGR